MKIVADSNIPFVREAFAGLGDVHLVSGRELDADAVRDTEILLVRSVTRVDKSLLENSAVKFVGTATIGTDHVDAVYLASRQIPFASAEGSNANSVAEYVVAALLELGRRHKFRLRDKVLGVVGVGNVGSRVVCFAEKLGMRVLQNDPPRQRNADIPDFVPLDRILAEADIVTLHVPLVRIGGDATFHMIDNSKLHALARPICLINTARGAVVDNRALLNAIDGRKVSGAALDVWENEPHISAELLDVVDVGTPHIAGYSLDGKVNGTLMIHRAACKFFGVDPLWNPAPLLPSPAVPRIELGVSSGADDEDVLRLAIERVYDIRADNAALRHCPTDFDRLRAEYPARREFPNTELVLRGASETLRKKFAALGFKLV